MVNKMEVIPAVDIRGGKCVRLLKGDFNRETVYGDDPAAMAGQWQTAGAAMLHVVDLDGAKEGRPVNRTAIRAIAAELDIPFEIGGGIRNAEAAAEYLALGADRVIIGTAAVNTPGLLSELCRNHPGRIVLGIDARKGKVATAGWLEEADLEAVDWARSMIEPGLAGIIYTDIDRDGTHTGVNVEATARLCRAVDVPVIAAGGVSTLDHVRELLPLAKDGLAGVITGKALYDGTMDLGQALKLARSGD